MRHVQESPPRPDHSDRPARRLLPGDSQLARSSMQSLQRSRQKLHGCAFGFARSLQKMVVSRVEAASKAITVEAAVPAAIMVGFCRRHAWHYRPLDQAVRVNPGNFPCWETIFKSRMPVIEATDADKTCKLSDPVIHLSRAS